MRRNCAPDEALCVRGYTFATGPLYADARRLLAARRSGVSFGRTLRICAAYFLFDPESGLLRAEAGITFDQILRLVLPQGWFLPVTPGTRFVSLGGAIANDVHGKHHHCAGTFGAHVVRFGLRRSDGARMECSRGENRAWFRATVAGPGLTGLIEWAEVQLKPVLNSWIDCETTRFGNLAEFHALSAQSARTQEYGAAWVDTLSAGRPGRGIFIGGNHNHDPALRQREAPAGPHISIPFIPPFSLLNRWTLRAFNTAFYRARPASRRTRSPIAPFLLSAGRDRGIPSSLWPRRHDPVAGAYSQPRSRL